MYNRAAKRLTEQLVAHFGGPVKAELFLHDLLNMHQHAVRSVFWLSVKPLAK